MIVSSIAVNLYMTSMIDQFGAPSSVHGSVMGNDFPASSIGSVFSIQSFVALLVIIGGAGLYTLSAPIGRFVTKDLI